MNTITESSNEMQSYTAVGGANWGFWGASSPFVSLTATQEHLTLSFLAWDVLSIQSKNVKEICIYKRFGSEGIKIIHCQKDCPEFVVFGSRDLKSLIEALRDLGYSIKD
ncbi:MAG: hypothetical protein HZB51_26680 [Chloroflexi bacterium]|nr:hypothetical protein [Chloroflexota bacterium]